MGHPAVSDECERKNIPPWLKPNHITRLGGTTEVVPFQNFFVRRDVIALQAADQEFAFIDHFGWDVVVDCDEEFFVADDFAFPLFAVDFLKDFEVGF